MTSPMDIKPSIDDIRDIKPSIDDIRDIKPSIDDIRDIIARYIDPSVDLEPLLPTDVKPSRANLPSMHGNPSVDIKNVSTLKCIQSNDLKSGVLDENASDNSREKIKFSTLFDLRHSDKKDTIDWCMSMGLIAPAYFCPKCGKSMELREKKNIPDGYEWYCQAKGLKEHISTRSIRKGSWLSKSKMNMCELIMLTHCWVYQMPQEWATLELDWSQDMVSNWYNCCRKICKRIGSISMIGGMSKTVEIGETQFKSKTSKVDDTDDVYIIGGIERESTKCFFKVIENRNSDTLLEVVKANVLPGTTIMSPCWKSYNCLDSKRFVDLAERKRYTFLKSESGLSTTYVALLRTLSHFMPASVDKVEPYLAEYAWRKNNCHSNDRMKSFIEAVKVVFPIRTRDLNE